MAISATRMKTIPGLHRTAQFQLAPRMIPLLPVPIVKVLSLSAHPEPPLLTSNRCVTRVTIRQIAIRIYGIQAFTRFMSLCFGSATFVVASQLFSHLSFASKVQTSLGTRKPFLVVKSTTNNAMIEGRSDTSSGPMNFAIRR